MEYILPSIFVFFMVYMIIPVLRKLAILVDFQDKPTNRKKHKLPTPLLGGLGIFFAFTLGFLVFMRPYQDKYLAILVASFLVIVIGFVDDWYKTKNKEFKAFPRLIVQSIASCIVYNAGIVFNGFTNPFNNEYLVFPEIVKFILTLTWIIGVTTVINWSDGIDGLAGSLSAIAGSTLFIVALVKNQNSSAMLSIMIVSSSIGFLKYNKHPAQIYMGDSGANFLGFLLGVIALDGAFKQATMVSIFIPILALGVPILDNLVVIFRRFKKGTPIYQADASQIHHRLIKSGLTPKQAWIFISLLSICLSLISIIILLLKL